MRGGRREELSQGLSRPHGPISHREVAGLGSRRGKGSPGGLGEGVAAGVTGLSCVWKTVV